MMWRWTIEMTYGGAIRKGSMSAEPYDDQPSWLPPDRIESMWLDRNGQAVVRIVVLAPTRAEADAKARAMYDRDVPDDMKQR